MPTEYSEDIKAAVLADIALGMPHLAIAKKHGVPRTTVIAWAQRYDGPIQTVTDSQRREDLGELVYEYIAAGLKALRAQADQMADPEWFAKQGAHAHRIHGTLADKLVIIFGGVERGSTEDVPALEPGEEEDSTS